MPTVCAEPLSPIITRSYFERISSLSPANAFIDILVTLTVTLDVFGKPYHVLIISLPPSVL